MIELYNEDCVKFIKSLPDNYIDALISDPPYGTNNGKGKVVKRGAEHTDFGVIDWDKEVPLSYLSEAYRVMKEDRWGFVFVNNIEITTVWNELERVGLKPRNTFYWIKYNKAPTPRANFKSNVETAIAFTKGRTNRTWNGGGNTPNYIEMPFVSGKEKVPHPTQKPVKLMSHLVELITREGDIVLDPFFGSGSTAVACANLNRNFVGCELDEGYFEIAKNRIEEAMEK